LSDAAAKERTDVTVKLANVVGETAETVSEWMTAIWNNFDDGSEKLEYYADVLAKLGAVTASSADEIAGGLEKFAAVAETVGLSYEYAASALATITAETRQSEDVVGTALKTIFARIESLKLGDTLEDGTALGQYSLALEKVGINIKDANGELKDMDTILDGIGNRWETLARDEQVALAQSVAGIRQYSQFIALMDNWDIMERNLETTEKANGALME
jgi:TP901 family phage tail tape measure protein